MTTRYLLDTSVVSSIAPGRIDARDPLLDWLLVTLPRVYLSTVSIYEIEQGIRKLERSGSQSRAEMMRQWLDQVLGQFAGDRLVALDADIAFETGRLADWAIARGVQPGVADIMIAATATVHDLVLLTYNMKHFGPLNIGAVDPNSLRR